jgi:amidase
VVEWDAKSHIPSYEMWLEAVLADGGGDCKALCEMHNEPLIEGMLVGKPENELTVMGRRQVVFPITTHTESFSFFVA